MLPNLLIYIFGYCRESVFATSLDNFCLRVLASLLTVIGSAPVRWPERKLELYALAVKNTEQQNI